MVYHICMVDINGGEKENLNDGFLFLECGEWAKGKLDYLYRYINAFSNAMKNCFSHRCYVDGFSGAGVNIIKDSGELIKGSPLISLSVDVPFTDYFFIEKYEKYYEALFKRMSKSNFNIHLYNDKINSVIKNIVNTISTLNNQVGIAFLDPYGFELEWTIIEQLASLERMDLLINFTQMGIKRNLENCYDSWIQVSSATMII